MLVDILITTYKRQEDLLKLLDNLRLQSYKEFSVKIFDGTPDTSVEKSVKDFNDSDKVNYKLRYYKTTAGMTRQRNEAVRNTEGDISIFLDDDVILQEDYLAKVVEVFEKDQEGKIGGLNGYDLHAATWLGKRKRIYRALGLLPDIGNARYLEWGHGTPHWVGGEFEGIRKCDLLIGHNMVWRTSVLKEYRFDKFYEQYPTYVLYDDQDICHRVRQQYELVQCGSAKLWHNVSASGRPPRSHYGFQALFNAHRNWKKFNSNVGLTSRFKFWLWEFLDTFFQFFNKKTRKISYGRIEAFSAIVRGYRDYDSWSNRKNNE